MNTGEKAGSARDHKSGVRVHSYPLPPLERDRGRPGGPPEIRAPQISGLVFRTVSGKIEAREILTSRRGVGGGA